MARSGTRSGTRSARAGRPSDRCRSRRLRKRHRCLLGTRTSRVSHPAGRNGVVRSPRYAWAWHLGSACAVPARAANDPGSSGWRRVLLDRTSRWTRGTYRVISRACQQPSDVRKCTSSQVSAGPPRGGNRKEIRAAKRKGRTSDDRLVNRPGRRSLRRSRASGLPGRGRSRRRSRPAARPAAAPPATAAATGRETRGWWPLGVAPGRRAPA